MQRFATSLATGFLALTGTITAVAAVNHMPAELRVALGKSADFSSFERVSAIPDSVRAAFAHAVGDDSFEMADRGAKWQATDTIGEENLPRRRLQGGSVSANLMVLFYEHGGIGRGFHVCVFRLNTDGAQLVWRAIRSEKVASLDDLNSAIRSGAVDDDLDYGF